VEWFVFVPLILLVAAVLLGLILTYAALFGPGQNPAWVLQVSGYVSTWWARLQDTPHARRGLIAGVIAGFVAAAAMVFAAWSHNPQGSVHGADGVSGFFLLALAVSWFVVVGGAVGALVAGMSAVLERMRRPAA
jgi:hypothetical protein